VRNKFLFFINKFQAFCYSSTKRLRYFHQLLIIFFSYFLWTTEIFTLLILHSLFLSSTVKFLQIGF
jgi:hypothetical protein